MKTLIVGDSLTGGYSVREDYSWSYILKSKYPNDIEVKTFNGATSSFIFDNLIEILHGENFDNIILSSGSNDILSNYDLSNIVSLLNRMFNFILEKNIKLYYLLPTNFVYGYFFKNENLDEAEVYKYRHEVENLISKIKNQSSSYDDTKFNLIDLSELITKKDYSDGVHFNEKFHEKIEKIIDKLINS